MYKVNGLFNSPPRRKLRELDFRAPEDRLSVEDDEEQKVRSPGIDRMIEEYVVADESNDDDGKASALRGMIDEMTALHKLRGVPVFAHAPLPPQFVIGRVNEMMSSGNGDIVSRIVDLVDPNDRAAVKMQFESALLAAGRRDGQFPTLDALQQIGAVAKKASTFKSLRASRRSGAH